MKLLDVLLAIAVAVIWGMGFVLAKAAIEYFPPILLMALRFSVTALVLVWFVRVPLDQLGQIALIALVGSAIQYSLVFTGLRDLEASTAIIIVQLEVPFAVLLATVFLKDPLGLRRVAGIVLAFAGIALIAGEPTLEGSYFPATLVVIGTFMWAMGQVMVKALRPVPGFTLVAWLAVFAAPQLFLSSWIFESGQLQAVRDAPAVVWVSVVYLGVLMTALGYGVWYHLLGRYSVNRVMPYLLLVPISTIAGGVLFLGETFTSRLAAGALLAIAGVAVINIERNPLRRRAD